MQLFDECSTVVRSDRIDAAWWDGDEIVVQVAGINDPIHLGYADEDVAMRDMVNIQAAIEAHDPINLKPGASDRRSPC